MAYRILRSWPSAEDATQQAMLRIWRQLPTLRDPNRFEAWAYRLLVNASYDEHRRLRHETSSDGIVDGVGADPYTSVNDRDQLERGFARLSKEQRTVLVL